MSHGTLVRLNASTQEDAQREAIQVAQTAGKKLSAVMLKFPRMINKRSNFVQEDGRFVVLEITSIPAGEGYWEARLAD